MSNSGLYSYFSSNIEWSEYYGLNNFHLTNPFHRHPKYFLDGVFILNNVSNGNFENIMDSAKCNFNMNARLKILNKTSGGLETFIFSSPVKDRMYINMLLNEVGLLRLFIERFRCDNQVVFRAAEESSIDIGKQLGPVFYQNSFPAPGLSSVRRSFLKKMGIEIVQDLSPRESGVLKLLLQGYSAGKIAPQLFLSKRTVEHHVERIKEKLRCESKAELIQKARELERYGCLNLCERD